MRNTFNVFFGLIFVIGGVILGFWANSHHPDNISLQKLFLDKDFWVFNSLEGFYIVMGVACFLTGVGLIGIIQQIVAQSKSENQTGEPQKTWENGCLVSVVTVFFIIIFLITLIATFGKQTSQPQPSLQKPPVPVVVTLRDSLVGEGMVAVFTNQTSSNLRINVTLETKKNTKLSQAISILNRMENKRLVGLRAGNF